MVIWGNHSSTQFPDANHCEVDGKPVGTRVSAEQKAYLEGGFIADIQQRGKAVIEARGASSALSAAHSACDHIRDWTLGTLPGTFVSMAVSSDGNTYGIPEGLIYSFPCVCFNGKWKIKEGLHITDAARERMATTAAELVEEQADAKAVLAESA